MIKLQSRNTQNIHMYSNILVYIGQVRSMTQGCHLCYSLSYTIGLGWKEQDHFELSW